MRVFTDCNICLQFRGKQFHQGIFSQRKTNKMKLLFPKLAFQFRTLQHLFNTTWIELELEIQNDFFIEEELNMLLNKFV